MTARRIRRTQEVSVLVSTLLTDKLVCELVVREQMYQPAYNPYGDYYGYDSYDPYSYDYTYYKGKKGIPQLSERKGMHPPRKAMQGRTRRPARFQSKALFPPFHPAAGEHCKPASMLSVQPCSRVVARIRGL